MSANQSQFQNSFILKLPFISCLHILKTNNTKIGKILKAETILSIFQLVYPTQLVPDMSKLGTF